MRTLSLTRALAEVKNLTDKIDDCSREYLFAINVGNRVHHREKEYASVQSFKESTKGALDKLNGLIEEKRKLRSAIAKANLETIVEVTLFGKEVKMSILELIDAKDIYKKYLSILRKYIRKYEDVLEEVSRTVDTLNEKVEEQVKVARASNVPQSKDLVDNIRKSLEPIYLGTLVSNFTKEQLSKMYDEVEAFVNTIDITLSEVNARTDIVVK